MGLRTITNNYADVEIVNLDRWSGERGPFLVIQIGIAPRDDQMRERLFVLRPDGFWVDLNFYLSSDDRTAVEEALFQSTRDVMELMGRLDHTADVADLPVSEEGLRQYLARASASPGLDSARRWVADYKARRRAEEEQGG